MPIDSATRNRPDRSHERGVLFVAADDQLRSFIAQYIKGRHDLSARYAEYVFDTLSHQDSDQQASGRLPFFSCFSFPPG